MSSISSKNSSRMPSSTPSLLYMLVGICLFGAGYWMATAMSNSIICESVKSTRDWTEEYVIMRKDTLVTRETSYFTIAASNTLSSMWLQVDDAVNDSGASMTVLPRIVADYLQLRSHSKFVLSFSSASGEMLMYLATALIQVGHLPAKVVVVAIDEPNDGEEPLCLIGIDLQKELRLLCDHYALKCYPIGAVPPPLKTEAFMLQWLPLAKGEVHSADLVPISNLPSLKGVSTADYLASLRDTSRALRGDGQEDLVIPSGGWVPNRRRRSVPH